MQPQLDTANLNISAYQLNRAATEPQLMNFPADQLNSENIFQLISCLANFSVDKLHSFGAFQLPQCMG